MPPYHKNQLTMVGPDSGDTKPQSTIKSSKRKRSSKYTMSDHKSTPPSGGPVNGHEQTVDGNGTFDGNGMANSTVNGTVNGMVNGYGQIPQNHIVGGLGLGVDGQAVNRECYSTLNAFDSGALPVYDAYHSEDHAFNYLLPSPESYNGGGDYGQALVPFAAAYSTPSDEALYPYQSNAYDCFAVGEDAPTGPGLEGHDFQNIQRMIQELNATTAAEATEAAEAEPEVKCEVDGDTASVSHILPFENESEESDFEERRPSKSAKLSKTPKKNKGGELRKPRQPRAKLLKWDDNDWKNVALGLVWACGENGIQIPFEQASQVVSDSCTAGALQQALLKLRGKQLSEGFQIPNLKMAWTRKNRKTTSVEPRVNSIKQEESSTNGTLKNTLPRKKPTRNEGHQSFMVTLKRPYIEADRYHLVAPHTPRKEVRFAELPPPHTPRRARRSPPADVPSPLAFRRTSPAIRRRDALAARRTSPSASPTLFAPLAASYPGLTMEDFLRYHAPQPYVPTAPNTQNQGPRTPLKRYIKGEHDFSSWDTHGIDHSNGGGGGGFGGGSSGNDGSKGLH
jgi:hypothetical protein